ncbi:MAG: TetR/AcrR family transcriptional regulator; helix-turn-helix transcriptional regulator, partial [Treponema sp.]|nr:TetR/AcrR family transcriptional regulator; helix-turn-helix transcriptional regulator [Treponema sp.]
MTRNDIVDAAFRVWGQELYKNTSLSKLAKALGVSKAALYRHFSDKNALFKAMDNRFFDSYAESLKPELEKVAAAENKREKLLGMTRATTKYFAGNFPFFIFSFFTWNKLNRPGLRLSHFLEELEKRGVSFPFLNKKNLPFPKSQYPSVVFLAGTTSLFGPKLFYKKCRSPEVPLTEEELELCVNSTVEKVWHGLCFDKELIDRVPFEKLENLAVSEFPESDPLLKAVAKAVADAGAWNASMETVARLSGLSKSGLYAHFTSKRDMLSRLFMTEFERIAGIAKACSGLSPRWEERLYLVIFSIAAYLKSRPEILVAMDWVCVQRLELDISLPFRLFDFFSGINIGSGLGSEDISQWVFLLLGMVLMRYYHTENDLNLPRRALRKTFRFITLGIEGF